jgi:hypothetical protein
MIASLPTNGQEVAGASVYQCSVRAAERDQTTVPSYIPAAPSPEIRRQAYLRQYKNIKIDSGPGDTGTGNLWVIVITRDDPTAYYRDPRGVGNKPKPAATGASVEAIGPWPTISKDDDIKNKQILSEEAVDVLVLFGVDPGLTTGFYEVGTWPGVGKEDGNPQSGGGQLAVVQSCYCSVDPNAAFCPTIT